MIVSSSLCNSLAIQFQGTCNVSGKVIAVGVERLGGLVVSKVTAEEEKKATCGAVSSGLRVYSPAKRGNKS